MSPAKQLVLAFPGDLATRTGGYRYDRRLALGLEDRGWSVERLSLPASFPFPSPEDLALTAAALGRLPAGVTILVDGLALGAMPTVAAELAARLDLVGLVHHPLCLESGLTTRESAGLAASERAALAAARAVIVTSPSTASAVAELMAVPPDRVTVAVPGTDPAPMARPSTDGVTRMLCVGTVTPRKAHRLLLHALAGVRGSWRLSCAGSVDRDPRCALDLRATIVELGLGERVALLGELDETALAALYARTDLLVSASRHEGYGMALAEALARGVPIVATAAGAVRDTVPPAAGLLVPPGDVDALRGALQAFVDDPELAARLRAGAIAARASLPSWAATAARVETTLLAARR